MSSSFNYFRLYEFRKTQVCVNATNNHKGLTQMDFAIHIPIESNQR